MNVPQLLSLFALWAASSSALVTSADRLTYEAPPGCPSEPEFVAAVAARGADIGRPQATDHRRLVVSIRRGAAGFEGAFHVRDGRDATNNREVAGPSCAEVADALAMVTAIALDTAAQAGAGAGAPPSPAVVAAAPETSATRGGTGSAAGSSLARAQDGLRGSTRIFPARSETLQVHAGALHFDLARTVTIHAGASAGLIPSVVLPRYDLSMVAASFITTPDGDQRISGVIFQPRLSFSVEAPTNHRTRRPTLRVCPSALIFASHRFTTPRGWSCCSAVATGAV